MANLNRIDYFTITTTGNASDFGNMNGTNRYTAATDNGTDDGGVCMGGADSGRANIDYITISSTGNAGDFGDLINTYAPIQAAGFSNSTNDRGVIGGGTQPAGNPNPVGIVNVIQYITITSTGNGTDFGDLTVARETYEGLSSGTQERGVFGSGNTTAISRKTLDYITINSAGNATDFGDPFADTHAMGAMSDCGT